MQKVGKDGKENTWKQLIFTWAMRLVATALTALAIVFLILCSMQVPVVKAIEKDYNAINPTYNVLASQDKELQDFKEKLTAEREALAFESALAEFGLVKADVTYAQFEDAAVKALFDKEIDETTFNGLLAKVRGTEELTDADAIVLKEFLETYSLSDRITYTNFKKEVAKAKLGYAADEAKFGTLKTYAFVGASLAPQLTSKLESHLKKIKEQEGTVKTLKEEYGLECDLEGIKSLINNTLAVAKEYQGDVTSVSKITVLIATIHGHKLELYACSAPIQIEHASLAKELQEEKGWYSTYLWIWLISEILAILASSALLTMGDMFAGNTKLSRILGGVLFILSAVQLLLFLHIGLMK
ncbi:MAG: hypothetical protein IJY11_01770 [Clostridia bacterium]|nr:hypothetical protein [Clostridia bacterium]